MKTFSWIVPALLVLAAPAFAADSSALHVRLRVVRACELPLVATDIRPARCTAGLPQARDSALQPAPAPLRALTPPSPQQDANEAEFATYTF